MEFTLRTSQAFKPTTVVVVEQSEDCLQITLQFRYVLVQFGEGGLLVVAQSKPLSKFLAFCSSFCLPFIGFAGQWRFGLLYFLTLTGKPLERVLKIALGGENLPHFDIPGRCE